jgi:dienelactone hydrolase
VILKKKNNSLLRITFISSNFVPQERRMVNLGKNNEFFLLFALLASPMFVWAKQCESNYPAAALSQGTKQNIHPGVNFVEPPYAGFDPCNDSVDIKLNDKSDTFVVVLHGAGGLDIPTTGIGNQFQKAGFSVLMFDAFKMNKISRDGVFWASTVHAGSTGRMIYFSGLASLKWLEKNHPERSKRIIVYGISTGGTAAAHLAATDGLERLQMVFAEGPNNAGIGLPDQLMKPVHVFYGALDNFGGSTAEEFLWKRRSNCLWNSPIYNMPASNTAKCNYSTWARGDRGKTVEEWVDEQKTKKADITFKLIDNASHGIFNGRDINSLVRATPSGIKLYWTTGAKPGVADQLFADLLLLINKGK